MYILRSRHQYLLFLTLTRDVPHVCETRKFVMVIFRWKQGLLRDKKIYTKYDWNINVSCALEKGGLKHLSTHYQTTNFRLFQTERVCRQQFQIWQKVIQTGRKHCGKKEKLLVTFSKGLFPRGVKRCHCVGMG